MPPKFVTQPSQEPLEKVPKSEHFAKKGKSNLYTHRNIYNLCRPNTFYFKSILHLSQGQNQTQNLNAFHIHFQNSFIDYIIGSNKLFLKKKKGDNF